MGTAVERAAAVAKQAGSEAAAQAGYRQARESKLGHAYNDLQRMRVCDAERGISYRKNKDVEQKAPSLEISYPSNDGNILFLLQDLLSRVILVDHTTVLSLFLSFCRRAELVMIWCLKFR